MEVNLRHPLIPMPLSEKLVLKYSSQTNLMCQIWVRITNIVYSVYIIVSNALILWFIMFKKISSFEIEKYSRNYRIHFK